MHGPDEGVYGQCAHMYASGCWVHGPCARVHGPCTARVSAQEQWRWQGLEKENGNSGYLGRQQLCVGSRFFDGEVSVAREREENG